MANRTITSLPPVSGLSGAEVTAVDQNDGLGNIGTFKATIDQITTLVEGALNVPQLPHTALMGAVSGVTVPTFRQIVISDLPTPWSLTPTGTGVPVLQTSPTINTPVINNPTGITKANVGLGNVDNTSDATKNAAVASLTNKTINADLNNIQNIDDNEIKVGANIDAAKIGTGIVSTTEFNYLDGVTSPIQGQLTGLTGPGLVPIKPLNPANDTVPYYTGPTTAALATFTQAGRDLVSGGTAAIQRGTLGLGNVDNTSDATKNAAAVALTNKTINADLNTITNIDNNEIKAAAGIDATKIGTGAVDNTELAYLNGATSNIQFQIDSIVASGGGGPGTVPIAPLIPAANTFPYYTGTTTGAITPLTAAGRALLDDADATTMRGTLGLGTASVENTGTTGHTVPFADGANTWTATNNFNTTASGISPVTVTSSDAGAAAGPFLDLWRTSASPAAGDGLAAVRFLGMSSTAVGRSYTQINAQILDPTNTAEAAQLNFLTYVAGTITARFSIAQGAWVGTPTGGDKGLDTFNVGTIYENGTALTAKYGQLAAANTWTGSQSINISSGAGLAITSSAGGVSFSLTSNDAGSLGAGWLTTHNSASPLAGDIVGFWQANANDSGLALDAVTQFQAVYETVTAGVEDANFTFRTMRAGARGTRVIIGNGVQVHNASSVPPTGGDMGSGTLNVGAALYEAGVALTAKYGQLTAAANTWTGKQTISTPSAGVNSLELLSTDGGATLGPIMALRRVGGSPLATDGLGRISWMGQDSALAEQFYAALDVTLADPSSSNRTGFYSFSTAQANTVAARVSIGAGVYTSGAVDKGVGSVNAAALYEAGVALTAKYGQLASFNTWGDAQFINITTAGAPAIRMISTDSGAVAGPLLDISRDSTTPAANDQLGQIRFLGKTSAPNTVSYANIYTKIGDPTDASKQSSLVFETYSGNVFGPALTLWKGATVGAAVGGDQGNNTLNATTLYEGGVALINKYAQLGTPVNVQRPTVTGNYVPSAGATKALVILQAGGGGGGGVGSTSGTAIAGSGGAGETRIGVFSAATTLVTLGAFGGGAPASNTAGGTATDSTFGALMTSKGGTGGAGTPGATNGSGGTTPTGSGGVVVPPSAFPAAGQTAGVMSNSGAGSWFGTGGWTASGGATTSGRSAGGPGGGGMGAMHSSSAVPVGGGDGGDPLCLIFEFR